MRIYTIGHSNRSLTDLIAALHANAIGLLVDIRAFPRSRRFPHFNRATLEGRLANADIGYLWCGDALGGFRKPRADSAHTALVDAAFRGFADYMGTAEFGAAIEHLLGLAERHALTIMCAEADFRHCHRQFIADYLCGCAVEVRHINHSGHSLPHPLNPCRDDASNPAVYNKHEQGDLFGSLTP